MCNRAENERGTQLPGNPREMITSAERRFPVRIRIAVPPQGLGQRHTQIIAWLDENCGADGWAMTPSGPRGVLNDALSIYFADATLASAFVARWCQRSTQQRVYSWYASMSRNHGLGRGCIGHPSAISSLYRARRLPRGSPKVNPGEGG